MEFNTEEVNSKFYWLRLFYKTDLRTVTSRKDTENLELDRRWSVPVKGLWCIHLFSYNLKYEKWAKDQSEALSKQLFDFHPLRNLLQRSIPRSSERHLIGKKQLQPLTTTIPLQKKKKKSPLTSHNFTISFEIIGITLYLQRYQIVCVYIHNSHSSLDQRPQHSPIKSPKCFLHCVEAAAT